MNGLQSRRVGDKIYGKHHLTTQDNKQANCCLNKSYF